MFLSKTDPNVCLLFNDGAQEPKNKINEKLMGFIIHSACKTHLVDVAFSGLMLFQDLQSN